VTLPWLLAEESQSSGGYVTAAADPDAAAFADYPATMDVAGRTLTPELQKALTYWPDIVHTKRPEPVDLAVLPPFFNHLLAELPWWNSAWQVTQVEPAYPREVASNDDRQKNRFTEVSVPGTLGGSAGQTLPFFGRVRFEGNLLLRFHAKIADTIVGPALAEAGAPEPHPFGAVLRKLMDSRGVSVKELALRTARAMSTIHAARTGWHNPHPVLVHEIARALSVPEEDLAAIAGVDNAPAGVPRDINAQHGRPQ
jgi:hypothetical protein